MADPKIFEFKMNEPTPAEFDNIMKSGISPVKIMAQKDGTYTVSINKQPQMDANGKPLVIKPTDIIKFSPLNGDRSRAIIAVEGAEGKTPPTIQMDVQLNNVSGPFRESNKGSHMIRRSGNATDLIGLKVTDIKANGKPTGKVEIASDDNGLNADKDGNVTLTVMEKGKKITIISEKGAPGVQILNPMDSRPGVVAQPFITLNAKNAPVGKADNLSTAEEYASYRERTLNRVEQIVNKDPKVNDLKVKSQWYGLTRFVNPLTGKQEWPGMKALEGKTVGNVVEPKEPIDKKMSMNRAIQQANGEIALNYTKPATDQLKPSESIPAIADVIGNSRT